jgi:hypothetical protein
MEPELLKKLDDLASSANTQEKKIDDIYKSVEKTRKYFLWTLIITVVTIVLPLVGLLFVIPWMLNTMTSAYGL